MPISYPEECGEDVVVDLEGGDPVGQGAERTWNFP